MRFWPFVSAARFEDMRVDRDYHRTRCERLIDAGLARRGEIHAPVMRDPTPRPDTNPLQDVMQSLATIEIDSRRASTHR